MDPSILERQLTTAADTIYEHILNLNIPMAQLANDWNRLMQLRSKILVMYGVPMKDAAVPAPKATSGITAPGMANPMQAVLAMMGGMRPMAAAAPWGVDVGAGAGGGSQDSDYKSKLGHLVSKRCQRSLTKSDLVYTVQEAEGGGFHACLIGPTVLSQEYWSEAPASSKRAAEHAAARAALQAEFPEALAGEAWGDAAWGAAAPPAAKKRKLEPAAAVQPANAGLEDPKAVLRHHAQLLLGRSCLKTDVVYDVKEIETPTGKLFQATVVLPEYDAQAIHQGAPAENSRQAQTNAAQAAIDSWMHIVAPLEAQRVEKKDQQKREKREAWRAKKEAEKAGAPTGGAAPAAAAGQ